jgi:hypothetical protein
VLCNVNSPQTDTITSQAVCAALLSWVHCDGTHAHEFRAREWTIGNHTT